MTDHFLRRLSPRPALPALLLALMAAGAWAQGTPPARVRTGDYIAVIVNQELVTAGEVDRRVERALAELDEAARERNRPRIVPLRLKWAAMMAAIVAVMASMASAPCSANALSNIAPITRPSAMLLNS